MKRASCLCCGSEELVQIVNLGMHPFADSFFTENDKYQGVVSYPLGCSICQSCCLIQTSCITVAENRYLDVDYAYNSENSSLAREHWKAFADCDRDWGLKHSDLVLEIGSNDGYLLSLFESKGYKALGIDPAYSQAKRARERGLEVIEEIFTSTVAKNILQKLPRKPMLIVANNVFNHSDDPLDFLYGVNELLHPELQLVLVLPLSCPHDNPPKISLKSLRMFYTTNFEYFLR